VCLMVQFTAAECRVAMFPKILWQGHPILEVRKVAEPVEIAVDTSVGRVQTGHDGRARRTAQRCGAVGLFEEHAALGQCINVRCLRLRMAAEAADPIIQIIDGNE